MNMQFVTLLLVTFAIAVGVCFGVTRLFSRPIQTILRRLVNEPLATAWHRYMSFAIYVVGVSGGARLWELEQYLTPNYKGLGTGLVTLDGNRWVLEIYSTLIQTCQSVAWMLLLFFMVALLAHVIMRASELKWGHKTQEGETRRPEAEREQARLEPALKP